MLVTSGMASMVLALLIWFSDVKGYQQLTRIPLIFGANAIVAYVLHVAMEKLLEVPVAGQSVHGAYQHWVAALGWNQFFSVGVWIAAFLVLCYLPVWWLYQRKIFVKI